MVYSVQRLDRIVPHFISYIFPFHKIKISVSKDQNAVYIRYLIYCVPDFLLHIKQINNFLIYLLFKVGKFNNSIDESRIGRMTFVCSFFGQIR